MDPNDPLYNYLHYAGVLLGLLTFLVFVWLGLRTSPLVSKRSTQYFAILLIVAFIAIFFFFRNPSIPTTEDCRNVLSPTSGVVSSVDNQETQTVVKIRLSLFDEHVIVAPASGIVSQIIANPQIQDEERVRITITTSCGPEITFEPSVGKLGSGNWSWLPGLLVKPRIVIPILQDKTVQQGSRLGMIRFGSLLTIYIPRDTFRNRATVGLRVRAGRTVLAVMP